MAGIGHAPFGQHPPESGDSKPCSLCMQPRTQATLTAVTRTDRCTQTHTALRRQTSPRDSA